MPLHPLSYISGVPLHDVWFGHQINGGDLEGNCRTRALESIASAMIAARLFFVSDYLAVVLFLQATGPR